MLAQFTILFYVARLGWCSRGQAATDFAVQSAAFRLGATAAVGLGGAIAAAAGWQGFFAFYAGYVTLVTVLFYWLEPRIAAEVARRERAAAQPGADGLVPDAGPRLTDRQAAARGAD
jgi:predicted MFS family arabinose efflux permease